VAGAVGLVLVALVVLTTGTSLIPDQWWERMGTIRTYDEDKSALGRLEAWGVAYRLALDRPLTGGGFWALPHEEVYVAYGASPGAMVLSAHSIYFSVLGDHGFVTLGIFILLIVSCLASCVRLRRRMGRVPDGNWIVRPAHMLEVSFAAFMVSGAFLTEAYMDLFYHLVSAVIILKTLAAQIEAPVPAVAPSEPTRAIALTSARAARRAAIRREAES
jgi:probable O-glycosylation ligase (exosortase A-associated)